MRKIILIVASILSISCNQTTQKETITQKPITFRKENKSKKVFLTNFTYEDVARYSISSIMGQPPKKIKVYQKDFLYYLSYIRKSDNQKFDYKITFDGSKILWANIDGRWRNSIRDEKISFIEDGDKLNIIQSFSDGSKDVQTYLKGE